MIDMLKLVETIAIMILISGILHGMFTTLQLFVAFGEYYMQPPINEVKEQWLHYAQYAPYISILVPAYNEQATIISSIEALLDNEYPEFEIVIINDGSNDNTIELLKSHFQLELVENTELGIAFSNSLKHKEIKAIYRSKTSHILSVIDKENGGKADALNAGVNLARGEYVCIIDADSILDKDALLRASKAFINSPKQIIAIGGSIRVVNGCTIKGNEISKIGLPKNILALFQTVEYLRTFHIARTAMSTAGALSLISGAFGLFSRDIILKVGGYSANTVGEDYELCLRIHRYLGDKGLQEKAMIYCPEAICWTQVPQDLTSLSNQRKRWQRGALEALNQNSRLMLNPKYGRTGTVSTSEAFISDVLTPLTEFLGHILTIFAAIFGILSIKYYFAFFLISAGFGVLHSAGAIALEEMRFRRFPKSHHLLLLYAVSIIENFGYRQLCGFWRLLGFIEYLQRKKEWGKIDRSSFQIAK